MTATMFRAIACSIVIAALLCCAVVWVLMLYLLIGGLIGIATTP